MRNFQTPRHGHRALALTALAGLALAAPAARAGTITLYNTGVTFTGAAATGGSVDGHYAQIAPTSGAAYVENNPALYAWTTSPTSQWIGPDTNEGDGNYTDTYQTTFSLAGFDPTTAVISGDWSTDNEGLDILVNGHSTGFTSAGFGAFTHFVLPAADLTGGLNTLAFQFRNDGGPGGLNVTNLRGTANALPTPEPSSVAAFGFAALGAASLILRARRRTA